MLVVAAPLSWGTVPGFCAGCIAWCEMGISASCRGLALGAGRLSPGCSSEDDGAWGRVRSVL